MIGQNPTKTLAYSLYNKLITEKNWLLAKKWVITHSKIQILCIIFVSLILILEKV